MRRFLLTLAFSAAWLQATTFTYKSCTAGATTLSPCDSDVTLTSGGLVSSQYVVRAYAAAPSPFANGAPVSAYATGLGQLNAPVGSISLSGIAEASDSMTYQSAGPARAGFIQFEIGLTYANEDPSSAAAMLKGGVDSYSFNGYGGSVPPVSCFIESCVYVGTLPFELGSPFQITASAMAYANPQEGGSESLLSFSLLEADATTPAEYSAVPEPFTRGVQIVGLGLIACTLWKRQSGPKQNARCSTRPGLNCRRLL